MTAKTTARKRQRARTAQKLDVPEVGESLPDLEEFPVIAVLTRGRFYHLMGTAEFPLGKGVPISLETKAILERDATERLSWKDLRRGKTVTVEKTLPKFVFFLRADGNRLPDHEYPDREITNEAPDSERDRYLEQVVAAARIDDLDSLADVDADKA